MKIAIVGAGRIGTTFAFHLARGGHEVTLVARGKRLEELQGAGAIEAINGDRATVKAAAALDATTPWDLALVTVLAHQVDAVLPALTASAAKTVMFMFNTFEPLDRLRDAVGAERFAFAFPVVTAFFVDGKLKSNVKQPGQSTTMSSDVWAELFRKAGIPSGVEKDMHSFLRSHVAFVVPLMAVGCLAHARGGGLTWAEARRHAGAMAEAFEVVRGLGHKVIPSMIAALGRLPGLMTTSLLWSVSRVAGVRDLGAMGPGEARQLIDAMTAAAPGRTSKLLAIRP